MPDLPLKQKPELEADSLNYVRLLLHSTKPKQAILYG